MDVPDFREALLQVMEGKTHWAWPSFADGSVPVERLNLHLELEYAVYVRDFAWLLGRAFAQCPLIEVRKELAENIFEEETGGLSLGIGHAELFLRIPEGLGMNVSRFHDVQLAGGARAYRDFLDDATTNRGWEIATAVTTLFLEGTRWDRGELDPDSPKRPMPPLDQHPLARNYGLSTEYLTLAQVHRDVEGGHRASAWHIMLEHVSPASREPVVAAMEEALASWKGYRDHVAEICGVKRELAA